MEKAAKPMFIKYDYQAEAYYYYIGNPGVKTDFRGVNGWAYLEDARRLFARHGYELKRREGAAGTYDIQEAPGFKREVE